MCRKPHNKQCRSSHRKIHKTKQHRRKPRKEKTCKNIGRRKQSKMRRKRKVCRTYHFQTNLKDARAETRMLVVGRVATVMIL
jgi:hypothetical protein